MRTTVTASGHTRTSHVDRRGLRRRTAAILVGALLLGTWSVLVPGAAQACACGVAYPGVGDRVTAGEEIALLSRDAKGRERLEMSLSLTGDTRDVAILIPTPAVPEVAQGSTERLDEVAGLSRPPEPPPEEGDGAAAGAPPQVVSRTVLDEVVATVIRGGDVAGVERWLRQHGYAQKPAVNPVIGEYLAKDWVFTAVKLRTDKALSGPVAPLVLSFPSEELVYPMRMSSAADEVEPVTVYVLAEEFVSRTDGTQDEQGATMIGAVAVGEPQVDDDVLDAAVEDGQDHLTAWEFDISDPASVTADFVFAADAEVEATHEVSGDANAEEAWLLPFLLGVGGGAVIVAVLGGVVALVRRRRGASGTQFG